MSAGSGYAYPPLWRALAAALVAVRNASLPALFVLILVSTDPSMTTPVLVGLFLVLYVSPTLAARLVAVARRVDVEVRDDRLVLTPGRDIPFAAVDAIRPWLVPLPGPGVSLRTGGEDPQRSGLATEDPLPLLVALAEAGVAGAERATRHASVVWAHARATLPRWRWYHYLAKFVLFALFPTAILFNAHQHIAFGGLFGEYYLLGRAAWLRTFAVYWTTVTLYVVLYASVWRGVAEGIGWLAAAIAPTRAARVRSAAETACRWLYYAGVPVLLLIRFLPF